jgi:hypothetical protein
MVSSEHSNKELSKISTTPLLRNCKFRKSKQKSVRSTLPLQTIRDKQASKITNSHFSMSPKHTHSLLPRENNKMLR